MIKKIIIFILFLFAFLIILFNYNLSKEMTSYINLNSKIYKVDNQTLKVSIKENNDVTIDGVQRYEPISLEFIKNNNKNYTLNIRNFMIESNICHQISKNIKKNTLLLENEESYILFLFNDNTLNFNSIRRGFLDSKIKKCRFDLQININNILKENKKLYLFDKVFIVEEFEIK